MVWLVGIDDGDDEHITVSLDMVTEQTTLSVNSYDYFRLSLFMKTNQYMIHINICLLFMSISVK